jgi:predicted nucleic acid-binding protein
MSAPQVLDTTAFVETIRGQREPAWIRSIVRSGRGYLSAVVAEELWAGTRSREDAEALNLLVRGFEGLGLVLTPRDEDWILAGRLLAQYQRLYGAVNPKDHTNDILIVLSASQVEGTVVTTNLRHMNQWVRMARRAGRQVWARRA